MREYETLYLLIPETAAQKSDELGNKLSQIVTSHSGQVLTSFNWGKRRTAYQVGRHQSGIYIYLNYLAEGNIVSEIERILKNDDSVLKFITVKIADDVNVEERVKEKREFTLTSIDEDSYERPVYDRGHEYSEYVSPKTV